MMLGVVCLFPKGARFLSTHLMLGSTIAFALSFVFSTGPIFLWFWVSEALRIQVGQAIGTTGAFGLLFLYLLAMVVGCIVGFFVGSRLALSINLFLGWQERTAQRGDAWSALYPKVRRFLKREQS
jgi:hypothetical protein